MHWVRLRWVVETAKKLAPHLEDPDDRREFVDCIQELVDRYVNPPSAVKQLQQLNAHMQRVLSEQDKDVITKWGTVVELITAYLNKQDCNEVDV